MHIVGADGELVGQGASGGGQAALRAQRRLRGAGRAGGEVEEEVVGRGGPGGVRPRVRVRGEEVVVLLRIGHQEAHAGKVQAGEEWQVGALGDQDPALGVQDVAGEFWAATGGVDAGDGASGEGGGAQPQRVLGGVVEQEPDMRTGRQEVGQQGRPGRGTGRHLVVGEHPPPLSASLERGDPHLAPQSRPVVTPPVGDEFGHRARLGLHGRAR
ncbi:hypothetical protein ADK57_18605 [Streptomyces sp. MMG1533]|nr:hypothetical protein ADK57_18605 [Streptomyces sp. MMG1533]